MLRVLGYLLTGEIDIIIQKCRVTLKNTSYYSYERFFRVRSITGDFQQCSNVLTKPFNSQDGVLVHGFYHNEK